MNNKIIVTGKPLDHSGDTKCPWCLQKVALKDVADHKKNCWYRHPVPTITVVDTGFVMNQPHMQ